MVVWQLFGFVLLLIPVRQVLDLRLLSLIRLLQLVLMVVAKLSLVAASPILHFVSVLESDQEADCGQ